MPALLQIAKGEQTDGRVGRELTEIFRGFGEDSDEEVTEMLDARNLSDAKLEPAGSS